LRYGDIVASRLSEPFSASGL